MISSRNSNQNHPQSIFFSFEGQFHAKKVAFSFDLIQTIAGILNALKYRSRLSDFEHKFPLNAERSDHKTQTEIILFAYFHQFKSKS